MNKSSPAVGNDSAHSITRQNKLIACYIGDTRLRLYLHNQITGAIILGSKSNYRVVFQSLGGLIRLVSGNLSIVLWLAVFGSSGALAEARKVFVISHRGGMGHYPQGSLAAIKHSLEIGVDFIELDVRMSADGIPVIYHDKTINAQLCRCADNSPLPNSLQVSKIPYAEILRFLCGGNGNSHFPEQVPTTERIHSLDAILAYIVAHDQTVHLMLELKPIERKRGRTFVQTVLQTLHKYGISARTNIQSRHPQYVQMVNKIAEQLGIPLLKGYTALPMQLPFKLGRFSKILPYLFKHREIIYFTANDHKQWEKLLNIGATGIITDYPQKLQRYLASQP